MIIQREEKACGESHVQSGVFHSKVNFGLKHEILGQMIEAFDSESRI
jgi:hypothetical protein